MNECDFCQRESEHLYPVNDGLWAICKECMEFEYGIIPAAYKKDEKQPLLVRSRNYNIYGEEE